MLLRCPVPNCSADPCTDLTTLAQHVFQLADWYARGARRGKGVAMRQLHYKWLKDRNITLTYEAVKKYLEDLLRRGKIEEV